MVACGRYDCVELLLSHPSVDLNVQEKVDKGLFAIANSLTILLCNRRKRLLCLNLSIVEE